jgi:epoxide hydrolase
MTHYPTTGSLAVDGLARLVQSLEMAPSTQLTPRGDIMPEAIAPFRIDVPQSTLDDLRQRLDRTRYPDQIPGTDWDYGAELSTVRELIDYWRTGYDWRRHEAELNSYPNFTTSIDGQSIHFLHARSTHEHALPLVISHGWPGSIVEFLKVLGPLTQPEKHGGDAGDAFHVVCPSLPGYGFSEVTKTRGWDARRIAEAFAELMARLGYQRYGAQGGDWGAIVGTELALLDAAHVCGLHTNMPLAFPDSSVELTEEERAIVAEMQQWERNEAGYQKIQGTKPQTLGFGLTDSPAGLAAWITEKFRTWSDCNGDVESVFTKDELLTNITVYWVTGTITSSTRLYYEVFKGGRIGLLENKVAVPTGVARFPKEIMRFPRKWVENHYNVTHWTTMPRGGHFAAMEQPELFVEDVRKFFRTIR